MTVNDEAGNRHSFHILRPDIVNFDAVKSKPLPESRHLFALVPGDDGVAHRRPATDRCLSAELCVLTVQAGQIYSPLVGSVLEGLDRMGTRYDSVDSLLAAINK